jgi:NAD(P)-dependent dehydrogenase (short-subunit alcohol dehydrogenase family)
MAKRVFITGVTGYIGGSVLTTLLEYPNKFQITALVRSEAQVPVLKKLGVTPVLGSLDDAEVLTKAASEADAVVNTADADHLAAVQALVKGLKLKNDKNAVFLHTSGTGVLTYTGERIEVPFDDADIERIHAIPIEAPHKSIDSWIYENTQDLVAAIIAPSTINGIGTGPFKRVSQQVVNLAKVAAARRKAGYVGGRTDTIWANVNINDLADLYLLVLNGLLDRTIDYGKQGGWYFGAVHEHTWVKAAELVAVELKKLGLVDSTEISEIEPQFLHHVWGEGARRLWIGDSRAVATRSRKIGWNPHRPDVYGTLAQEVLFLFHSGDLKSE